MTLFINQLVEQQPLEEKSEQCVEEESPPANDKSNVGSTMLLWEVVVDKET